MKRGKVRKRTWQAHLLDLALSVEGRRRGKETKLETGEEIKVEINWKENQSGIEMERKTKVKMNWKGKLK